MKALIVFLIAALFANPVLAKGTPSNQLINEIVDFYVQDLGLTKPPLPKISITSFCELQNHVTKTNNACAKQFIGMLFFGATLYKGAYTIGNPGIVRLTDNYDWNKPNKEALLILAHELAHHVLVSNGFEISDRNTHWLAKKFIRHYYAIGE